MGDDAPGGSASGPRSQPSCNSKAFHRRGCGARGGVPAGVSRSRTGTLADERPRFRFLTVRWLSHSRKQGDYTAMKSKAKKPGLIDKSFKVPVDVIRSIELLAPVFGSNGRAIQVGAELLISTRRKPKVKNNHVPVAAQTYSITPRTLVLIERLLPKYEKRGTVLRAVVQVLQEQLV